MGTKWQSTKFKGVRCRLHPTRKHGIQPDKYFAIRYQAGGKRKEEGLGWTSEGWSETKAVLELEKLREAHKKGEGPIRLGEKREKAEQKRQAEKKQKDLAKKASITFGDFFENTYFPQALANKTERSCQREKSLFTLWIGPVIDNLPFSEISPIQIERIKKNMADAGKAPRSVHYALAVIRQIFNYAILIDQYYGDNPIKKIKKPTYDNKRLRFLSHEEADKLLEALYFNSQPVYEMAAISLHCGLRAGEVFSLTFGDIDLQHGLLTLRDTKTVHSRTVHMTKVVKDIFSSKKGKPNELVFPGRGGVKITQVSNTFQRTMNELGFNEGVTDRRQKATFHTLRHTHASWLVMEGVDLYTVQKILGHSTLAMTQRYAHLAPDKFKAATKVFENGLKKGKKVDFVTYSRELC